MTPAAQLAQGLAALGLTLDAPAEAHLLAFAALLAKWNRTYNLTALRSPEQAVSHHLLDSLAILPAVGNGPLLDVGSGGGLPGIPLAIARPDLPVTLLDSNSKKTAFLTQAAIELGLAQVRVHTGRVEDLTGVRFPVITSRAFAELADFVGLTRHLIAPGGCWLAMKGVRPDAEIDRLRATLPHGIVVESVCPLTVPGVDGERHLVTIREQ